MILYFFVSGLDAITVVEILLKLVQGYSKYKQNYEPLLLYAIIAFQILLKLVQEHATYKQNYEPLTLLWRWTDVKAILVIFI